MVTGRLAYTGLWGPVGDVRRKTARGNFRGSVKKNEEVGVWVSLRKKPVIKKKTPIPGPKLVQRIREGRGKNLRKEDAESW